MSYGITAIMNGNRILIIEFPTRVKAFKKITDLKQRGVIERPRVARFNSRNRNRYEGNIISQELI